MAIAPNSERPKDDPQRNSLGFVMLTNTTTATRSASNVVGIADQMLDRYDAATFVRETFGVPLEVADLERAAKTGTGPVFRRWGRSRPLYRKADLVEWASSNLSGPIRPRGVASR
jgi:hypothetical protein